ncbi:hypothetical protein [Sinomonas albida]|uniref:hypothetical protein n=1 Tax=Sinomonas albida TaxID=369942 RepID=UPI003018FDB0
MPSAPPRPNRPIAVNSLDDSDEYPICARTARHYIAEGRLHGWRFGKSKLFVDRDELDALFVAVAR